MYAEENAVVSNVHLVQDLDAGENLELFSQEWTSCHHPVLKQIASLPRIYCVQRKKTTI